MKNLFRLLLLVILLTDMHQAFSQTAFGLKAGINLASINVEDAEATYDSRTGFHGGVFLRAKGENIGFQPELLLFTQRGERQETLLGTVEESFTYVSIPLMLKFYPVMGLNLQLGPQFGFLVDGERKYDDPVFGRRTDDIKDAYKSSDVSLSFGAGYDFDFGLGLDIRYNLGLQDINDLADGEEARSRVFLVSLGWNFLKD